jgi:formate dehydrogenase iron-sulfur subunit
MFKCDLCQDRLTEGKQPACVEVCPREAMLIGTRDEIYAEAEARAERMNGYIYGKNENGGTGTLYVSPVPFEKLDAAIACGPGRPHLKPVKRTLAKTDSIGKSVLMSPVIGLAAGIIAATGSLMERRKRDTEKTDNE